MRKNLSWPLYGGGIEYLGKNGKPVQYDLPEIKDDELLLEHDAVSLCFTDVKEVKFGETHPRLIGRDLKNDPVVPGHEVVFTVVEVGEKLKDRFHPGEIYAFQPDIKYKGVRIPFSFAMDGAYRQFGILGKEVTDSDSGSLLIKIPKDMPFAAAAITEPWACVEATYHEEFRNKIQDGGKLLVIASERSKEEKFEWKDCLKEHLPGSITFAGKANGLETEIEEFAKQNNISFNEVSLEELENRKSEFDDIILLNANNELVNLSTKLLAPKGVVVLVGKCTDEKVDLDLGIIHYDDIQYTGSESNNWKDAYDFEVRCELKKNGITMMQGSGGPMGLMHIQRALELENGPSVVVATDHHDDRLEHIQDFLGPIAREKNRTLITVNEYNKEEYKKVLDDVKAKGGFDDVVTMVAKPEAVIAAYDLLAENGVINVFSGMKRGTQGKFNAAKLQGKKRCFVLGHSGSILEDQKRIIDKFANHELNTWRSVAAIAGMNQVPDGIQAMIDSKYSGKIIIYPQVEDFPLSSLKDLKERLPQVYEKLSEGDTWNQEAENTFLSLMGARTSV